MNEKGVESNISIDDHVDQNEFDIQQHIQYHFDANHPFLYFIRDGYSGAILLSGLCENPEFPGRIESEESETDSTESDETPQSIEEEDEDEDFSDIDDI